MSRGKKRYPPAKLESDTKDVSQALARTVQDVPETTSLLPSDSFIIWIAQASDGIEPWGRRVKTRDRQLKLFVPTENFLCSALGIVSMRNAAMSWEIEGPPRTSKLAREMLLEANLGRGWEDFITNVSIDLYTQDLGAFIEIIRASDSPNAPVIGVNHLVTERCYPTGNPEEPVIYQKRNGKYTVLKDYQVINLMEMPVPQTYQLFEIQYSAVTRLLRAAQILKSISIYKEEKIGGRQHRVVHLVKGVDMDQLRIAMEGKATIADSQGLSRYLEPAMVGNVDPKADIGHDTIELATLPDGFDEEKTIKNYITILAMAFGTDYQEFAPLPGGNLGTSAQSEILHMKSKGKGPGLFKKLLTHFLNEKILPKNVEFKFTEVDLAEEKERADLALVRAQERRHRIESMEISPEIARQLAVDTGDLSQEIFDATGGLDLTGDVNLPDEDKPKEGKQPVSPTPLPEEIPPPPVPGAKAEMVGQDRLDMEEEVANEMGEALNAVYKKVQARLKKLRSQ